MRRSVLLNAPGAQWMLGGVLLLGGCAVPSSDGSAAPRPDSGQQGGADSGHEAGAGDLLAEFAPEQDESLSHRCDIGITPPSGEYEALEPGGIIPIAGIGQAGLTARTAVRVATEPPPASLEEAVVRLVLTNVVPEIEAESRPYGNPVRFECRDDGACYHAPVHVEISHLAPLPELEGLAVGVSLEVLDLTGEVLCRSRSYAVLDRL